MVELGRRDPRPEAAARLGHHRPRRGREPTSGCSRPARRPTSTSCAGGCPASPDRDVLMAGKRYRSSKHRMFHRDSGYLEGRRVRKSRETRAMRTRTSFGKELISGLWAFAEFETLVRLWDEGLPVPYPVQMSDDEMLMEFIGTPGRTRRTAARAGAARRRTCCRCSSSSCARRCSRLAELGWAHGDLSPYNVLLEGEGSSRGSSSSTGRRSSTSSATRTGRSSSNATPTTCVTGSRGVGTRWTRACSSVTSWRRRRRAGEPAAGSPRDADRGRAEARRSGGGHPFVGWPPSLARLRASVGEEVRRVAELAECTNDSSGSRERGSRARVRTQPGISASSSGPAGSAERDARSSRPSAAAPRSARSRPGGRSRRTGAPAAPSSVPAR